MLLVLTYHRIVERPEAIGDFFDVTAAELDRHLTLATRCWRRGASPRDLLAAGDAGREGFLVTFDDGTIDHYLTAAPVLERHGLRGVFFVNTELIGAAGRMTLGQCRELSARGHAIESHSHDHASLVDLSDSALRWQLTTSRDWLRAEGLGQHDFLAVPGGIFDARVLRVSGECGYRLVRTLEWGYNRGRDPLRIESVTMNRHTAGRWSGVLLSPGGEAAKKSLSRVKDVVKKVAPSVYRGMRDFTARTGPARVR